MMGGLAKQSGALTGQRRVAIHRTSIKAAQQKNHSTNVYTILVILVQAMDCIDTGD